MRVYREIVDRINKANGSGFWEESSGHEYARQLMKERIEEQVNAIELAWNEVVTGYAELHAQTLPSV